MSRTSASPLASSALSCSAPVHRVLASFVALDESTVTINSHSLQHTQASSHDDERSQASGDNSTAASSGAYALARRCVHYTRWCECVFVDEVRKRQRDTERVWRHNGIIASISLSVSHSLARVTRAPSVTLTRIAVLAD